VRDNDHHCIPRRELTRFKRQRSKGEGSWLSWMWKVERAVARTARVSGKSPDDAVLQDEVFLTQSWLLFLI